MIEIDAFNKYIRFRSMVSATWRQVIDDIICRLLSFLLEIRLAQVPLYCDFL